MKKYCLLLSLLLLLSCARETLPDNRQTVSFCLTAAPGLTKALDPDEYLITDYNLLIYNCFGILEEKVYVPARALTPDVSFRYTTTLLQEVPYTVLAVANLGYELPLMSLEEVKEYRYYLAYPDEFTQGLPMAAALEDWTLSFEPEVQLPLERLMARVDLNIDRTALDGDVQFQVTDVRIGGCPSSVRLFGPSRAENKEQVFLNGYLKDGHQVDALGRDSAPGISEPVSLYLLENCQGTLLDHVLSPQGKVFSDATYRDICSYIEIHALYRSDSWHTAPGEKLIYRFYLGDGLDNFDVFRNCWYRITVRPEGTGLNEDSWRVDKHALVPERRLALYPAAYNECASGEDYHIWCEVWPKNSPMTIELLGYEGREFYQYTLDADGNGLTIHSEKGGTAVISFQAGPPANLDTLAMLVIDP